MRKVRVIVLICLCMFGVKKGLDIVLEKKKIENNRTDDFIKKRKDVKETEENQAIEKDVEIKKEDEKKEISFVLLSTESENTNKISLEGSKDKEVTGNTVVAELEKNEDKENEVRKVNFVNVIDEKPEDKKEAVEEIPEVEEKLVIVKFKTDNKKNNNYLDLCVFAKKNRHQP